MSKQSTLGEIVKLIHDAKNILIVGHRLPEGDVVGSALCLYFTLQKMGKKPYLYNQDPIPKNLRFLPGARKFSCLLPFSKKFDLTLMVDVGEKGRVGENFVSHPCLGKIICLDHHAVSVHEGNLNFVLPDASSTGIVVYHVLKALGVKKLSYEVATNLYCTLITDTGSFRYSNTNRETFELAKLCLDSGVDPWFVARNCFETQPLSWFKMLCDVVTHMEIKMGGKILMASVSLAQLKKTKASLEQAEALASHLRTLEGVQVCAMLIEQKKGFFKISFRSNDSYDVGRLAKTLGGGGHRKAAGCEMHGPLSSIKKTILSELRKNLS